MTLRQFILAATCCLAEGVVGCANTSVGSDGAARDASADAADAADAVDAPGGALPPAEWPQPDPAAPRLIAPLSCTWHSSRRPTLRWVRPMGVERVVVEVCADRPCQRVEQTLEVSGDSVRVPDELPPGVHFWRAFALADGRRGAGSFTWEFRAPFRSRPNDLAVATYVDVNGDGYGDAIFHAGNALAPVVRLALHVYFGGPGGPRATYDQRLLDAAPYDAGDLNGDGFSDVVMSYFPYDRSDVPDVRIVYLGSPGGLLETSHQVGHTPAGSPHGGRFSTVGDVDGDGYSDVAYTFGGSNTPAEPTTVFLGSPTGYDPRRSFELVRPDARLTHFGMISDVGDFDGDSRLDLLVEAYPSVEPGGTYEPELWVVSNENLRGFPARTRRIPPPAGHRFGFGARRFRDTLRHCDLNGDGRSELLLQSRSLTDSQVAPLNRYVHDDLSGAVVHASNFDDLPLVQLDAARGIEFTCVPDLDGDGFNDVIGTTAGSRTSWVLRGSASGGGLPDVFIRDIETFWSMASWRATNDIDGDNRADIIVAGYPEALIFTTRGSDGSLPVRYRISDPGLSGNYGGPGPFGLGFLF